MIKPAVQRLFQTRDGELVLEYLMNKYYHCRFKEETLVRQAGQRDVLLHVKQLLAEDKNVQK